MPAMPFDNPTQSISDAAFGLFRQRREAAAALWRGIPLAQFDMDQWECGTTACALGWLAHKKHDGWCWNRRKSEAPVAPDGNAGFWGAEEYFGLSENDATSCFCSRGWLFHRRFNPEVTGPCLTPGQVATTLLALPYVLGEETRHAV
jgi:hypothetical protein